MAQKTKKQPSAAAPAEKPLTGPPVWLKAQLSIWIAWHLLVVFLSPFSVPPSSQLAVDLAQSKAVRWYTDQLYLNHGYHFFGPDPPINHLVRYTVWDSGGAVIAEGEFPNKQQQWPRLFYHRHMMLADQAGLAPVVYDGEIQPVTEENQEYAVRRSLEAYARHLLRKHSGSEARLDYVRHAILFPEQVEEGVDPSADWMFTPVMSVRQSVSDLPVPLDTSGEANG